MVFVYIKQPNGFDTTTVVESYTRCRTWIPLAIYGLEKNAKHVTADGLRPVV